MAETPDIQKGDAAQPGGAQQLPQGAAKTLNDANPVVRQEPIQAGAPPQQMAYETAPPGYDGTSGYKPPADEISQYLFSDPQQPKPLQNQNPEATAKRVPNYVVRHLPMMRQMLDDPAAPASLRAAYRAIAERLRQEYSVG